MFKMTENRTAMMETARGAAMEGHLLYIAKGDAKANRTARSLAAAGMLELVFTGEMYRHYAVVEEAATPVPPQAERLLPFLNEIAAETFEQYRAAGLTDIMVKAELRRSHDTLVSKSLVQIAAARNFITLPTVAAIDFSAIPATWTEAATEQLHLMFASFPQAAPQEAAIREETERTVRAGLSMGHMQLATIGYPQPAPTVAPVLPGDVRDGFTKATGLAMDWDHRTGR